MYRRFTSFSILLLALGVLVGLLWTTPAHADNLYASIHGTVTDPSGAVLPGVKLTATNVATGVSATTTSNKDGAYTFLQLPVGNYSVKAEGSGFKTYQTTGIKLDLNEVYALNVKLEVGTVSQELVVEANPVQVETTDMQLGTTISGNQIVDFPLNGRNWTQLQQLEPGIVGTSDRFGGNGGGYSGNGSETQQNNFMINGTDSNDSSLNTALVIPSPDSIGEFRLVTNTLNPEYGRNSGTIINAVIKNGTNQFHGDAFEFYRDTFLDAKSWFRLQPAPFHQNQFGGTVGGPIIKNKAFFFFSYQGLRATQPQAFNAPVVLSPAERTGDFSASGGFGSNVSPFPMVGADGITHPAGTAYTTLFPTGAIPTADLNPLAVKLMNQFVPLPNGPGNTFLFNPSTQTTNNQYIYRLDEKLRDADALWFYGLYQTAPSTDTLPFTGASVPGFGDENKRHTQEYTVAWNHTFSGTTLNEARFAYLRFNFAAVTPQDPINPTGYGFTGITPQNSALASLPVMNVAGLFTLGFSANGPQPRVQNTYQATDNFSKVIGHHTLKAGFTMERLEINNPFFNNLGGNFAYNGQGLFSTGNPGADFLLGIPDTYAQGSGSIVRARGREYYSYFQDQWQIKRNLTITLGTGWDIETPWRNLYANGEIMGAFRPGQQSTIFPTMPAGFVYPGDAGINQYGGPTVHYDNLAPRVGFAWSPGTSGNWSIRGGIGLYYNRSEEELALQTLTNAPFAVTSSGVGALGTTPNFANPFTSINPAAVGTVQQATATNPFPYIPPSPGTALSPTFIQSLEPIGLGFNTEDPRFTSPRATNYNLTVERQLTKSMILSVGYVGNQGRHEEGAYNLNQAGSAPGVNPTAAAYIAPGTNPPAPTCTTGFFLVTPFCAQPPSAGAPAFNLGVYGEPGFQTTEFNSYYNSLQVELNKHFSNGLQVLAAYTWSRYFDQTSSLENSSFNAPGINPFDVKSMWAPSANDAPQRFVISYTYTLPFYKLTHHWKRLTDDWTLVGAYTLQHGLPVPVFDLAQTSLTCDLGVSFYFCPDRANATGTALQFANPRTIQTAPNGGQGETGNYWFTNGNAAFTVPAPGTGVGNASRNPLYGPGINYSDMAIEKDIHIDEARYFQLRLETFNTFNHANFAQPLTPGFNAADVAEPGSFGQIFGVQTLTTNGDGRVLQLGAKFYF